MYVICNKLSFSVSFWISFKKKLFRSIFWPNDPWNFNVQTRTKCLSLKNLIFFTLTEKWWMNLRIYHVYVSIFYLHILHTYVTHIELYTIRRRHKINFNIQVTWLQILVQQLLTLVDKNYKFDTSFDNKSHFPVYFCKQR